MGWGGGGGRACKSMCGMPRSPSVYPGDGFIEGCVFEAKLTS